MLVPGQQTNKNVYLGLVVFLLLACGQRFWGTLTKVTGHNLAYQQQTDSLHKILVMCSTGKGVGGGEVATLEHYKTLQKHAINSLMLVPNNCPIIPILEKDKLPFYTYNAKALLSFTKHGLGIRWQPGLTAALKKLHKEENITIIHSNYVRDCTPLIAAKKQLGIKVVHTHHNPFTVPEQLASDLDGIIYVSPPTYHAAIQAKQSTFTSHLAPFFNQDKFLHYSPTTDRSAFFQTTFNLDVGNAPIISCVANLYSDISHKNHPVLLRAAAKLIHDHNTPVHVMLAGSTDSQLYDHYTQLIKELNIENYVHLLGYVNDIPGLLYHSDLTVLPSSNEAFGIALLEGALMKKPLVTSDTCGAAHALVRHNETGLLFKDNDTDDLADKLLQLVTNQELRTTLGQQAYDLACAEFSNEAKMKKLLCLYEKVGTQQKG